jgi:hypothetical protein
MKKPILWMIALAAISGSALYAQTMTGTWQGNVHRFARLGENHAGKKRGEYDADECSHVMHVDHCIT